MISCLVCLTDPTVASFEGFDLCIYNMCNYWLTK